MKKRTCHDPSPVTTRRLTPDERRRAVQRYAETGNYSVVAREFGVTRQAITHLVIRRLGVLPLRRGGPRCQVHGALLDALCERVMRSKAGGPPDHALREEIRRLTLAGIGATAIRRLTGAKMRTVWEEHGRMRAEGIWPVA